MPLCLLFAVLVASSALVQEARDARARRYWCEQPLAAVVTSKLQPVAQVYVRSMIYPSLLSNQGVVHEIRIFPLSLSLPAPPPLSAPPARERHPLPPLPPVCQGLPVRPVWSVPVERAAADGGGGGGDGVHGHTTAGELVYDGNRAFSEAMGEGREADRGDSVAPRHAFGMV